ncbi:hypothetical protein FAES_1446 [Fibrella aestuarina BUZ 2]|uniref:Cytochrome c domain-containing protein n=1 Tax=Fibrella aestuarina BUZ 2 TaxID=1166018 RepID=I0K5Q3_9BACT|nr:VCBS repeat-containing protein [Fibrella aestuarina]CCG99456.1 hypothetical protein FAES_1446 [Fibrella aestuarina BUZ 2]
MKNGLGLLAGGIILISALSIGLPMACKPAEATGQQLAEQHCGNCHQYPQPALLPKKTWLHGVLPQMALRLGLVGDTLALAQQISQQEERERGVQQGYLPAQPLLTPDEWKRLVDFYVDKAPDSLAVTEPAPTPSLTLFKPITPTKPLAALSTCVRIDPVAHRVIVGDQMGAIQTFDAHLQRTDSVRVVSPLTDVVRVPGQNTYARLLVGIMNPNDRKTGELRLPGEKGVDTLRRPVQLAVGDLNRDGKADWVVCEFGHNVGQLSAFIKTGNTYLETILDPTPGARRAIIQDVNADGWPDVVALLAQGDEQVAVYYGQPDGKFLKKTVLRFPPANGSSYLELADMNRDGKVDIVYTNGDNADYSQVYKPYHGVHIFLNDGTFGFKKAWTYAMPGAGQVLARDFDQDGDLDLVAISFFPLLDPNRQRPAQLFVYFENQGNLRFQARTWRGADVGRWLVMDAADLDGDGDEDIVLGSNFRSLSNTPAAWRQYWHDSPSGLLLLENQVRSAKAVATN